MLQITREPGEGVKVGTRTVIRFLHVLQKERVRMQIQTEGMKDAVFELDVNEEVNVGPEVTMMLMNISRGQQIRLGFTAARSIIINREEVA